MRVAIYARYSSDRQSERSIDDQVRLCRSSVEQRDGWQVVEVFPDYALSSATRDRPGLNSLLSRLSGFDIVLAEALDRISRDQEDVAAIWKRISFGGCRLVTVSEGEIGELQIGFTGTMSALFLKNLGDKTRRGQVGCVAAGRIPGGLSYGYETDAQIAARRSSAAIVGSFRNRPRWCGASSSGAPRGEAPPTSSSSSTARASPVQAAACGG